MYYFTWKLVFISNILSVVVVIGIGNVIKDIIEYQGRYKISFKFNVFLF